MLGVLHQPRFFEKTRHWPTRCTLATLRWWRHRRHFWKKSKGFTYYSAGLCILVSVSIVRLFVRVIDAAAHVCAKNRWDTLWPQVGEIQRASAGFRGYSRLFHGISYPTSQNPSKPYLRWFFWMLTIKSGCLYPQYSPVIWSFHIGNLTHG